MIVSGSIRSYSRTTQEDLKAQLARLAEEFQENSDASITFRYNDGYPSVHNDEQLYAAFSDSDLLHELPEPVLQAEDFGVYTEKYPCVFFFLGLGDTPALHEATFDFDMSVLEKGVSWYQRLLYTKGFF